MEQERLDEVMNAPVDGASQKSDDFVKDERSVAGKGGHESDKTVSDLEDSRKAITMIAIIFRKMLISVAPFMKLVKYRILRILGC